MDQEAMIAQVTKTGRLYMGLVFFTLPVLVGVAMFGRFKPPDIPSLPIYALLAFSTAVAPIGLALIWTKMLRYDALPAEGQPAPDDEGALAGLPPRARAFVGRLAILNGAVEFPGLGAFVGLVTGVPIEYCAAAAAVGLLCAVWAFVEIPKKARLVLIDRQ